MVFTSLTFIFLILPLFLALDASAKSSRIDIRNAVLLFVSVVFYTWGEGANVFILILMGIINYIAGEVIHKADNKKPYLILFVTLNLFTLFSYKVSLLGGCCDCSWGSVFKYCYAPWY